MSEPIAAYDSSDMGTAVLPGRTALEIAEVRALSGQSNARGLLQFAAHVTIMGATGVLVWLAQPHWYWLIPAMVLHGFTIVTMFAPMHECVHRTAFATRSLNEIFGWIAGLLSFYNFHYYRHYHTWHHRFTQDPEKDPELMTPKPRNFWQYLLELSGLTFWLFRPWLFLNLALGRTQKYAFLPERARTGVAISAAVQLGVYLAGIASIIWGPPWVLYYWFLPAILAQPLLRAILIVEHTGCSQDQNGLTNTRTTLTIFPVWILMWNMPYDAEHHLYPSIPFHELPHAHQKLREKLSHIAPSYVAANREVVSSLHSTPPGGAA
ncbi:MAG: fatty acid desaturase [Planctomycetaceae bacterium]|nr:fatty acid desaturase [Planctomycetaceae bacterium]